MPTSHVNLWSIDWDIFAFFGRALLASTVRVYARNVVNSYVFRLGKWGFIPVTCDFIDCAWFAGVDLENPSQINDPFSNFNIFNGKAFNSFNIL